MQFSQTSKERMKRTQEGVQEIDHIITISMYELDNMLLRHVRCKVNACCLLKCQKKDWKE